jgi:SmpA / OmlA family
MVATHGEVGSYIACHAASSVSPSSLATKSNLHEFQQLEPVKITILFCLLFLSSGCADVSTTTGTPKLSRSLVDSKLIKGETTKAKVRALLGEPQSTVSGDANISGGPAETWTYTKTFYRAPKKKEGVLGRVGRYIATGSPYDRVEESVLKVMFDDQGIVTGHTFSTSVAGVRD